MTQKLFAPAITWMILLGFLLGNAIKPTILGPDIHLTVLDGVVALIWILVLLFRGRLFFTKFFSFSLTKPILLFTLLGAISLVVVGSSYGSSALLAGSLYLFRWLVYSLLFIPFTLFLAPKDIRHLLKLLGLTMILTSIVQYTFMPDIRPLTAYDWDPHYFRVVGTLLDPGFVGILLIFSLLIFTPETGVLPLFRSVRWALSYLSLAFTYSRTSFLAFLAGFSFLAFLRKTPRLFVSALLLITVTLLILPRTSDGEGVKLERTSTIKARIASWTHTLIIFKDHPILGVGFNTYRYAQKTYGYISGADWQTSHGGGGADSSLLFVAATTGVIGLLAYFWYLSTLWQISQSDWAFKTGLVALFIHSWFLNSLFYPFVLVWLALWVSANLRVEGHR